MFFSKRASLAELPLDQVLFSSEDLFCLIGGMDACAVACAPSRVDYTYVVNEHPEQGVWRRNLVNRYQASGWVDKEGNPNDELARALAPLKAMGVAIRDENETRRSRVGVVLTDEGATGIVAAAGRGGGFFLRPFPRQRSEWPSFFRSLMPADAYPFSPARAETHDVWSEPAEEDLAGACGRRDEVYARTYAKRHGINAAATVELARNLRDSSFYEPLVVDCTSCEPTAEGGWVDRQTCRGPFKTRRCLVAPEIGAVFSDCNAWNPSVPLDWVTTDPESYRDATGFYSLDFHASGDLFEALCYVPAYPGQEDAEAAAVRRRRWLV